MSLSPDLLTEEEYFQDQLAFIEENYKELNNLYVSSTPLNEQVKDFLAIYVREVEKYTALLGRMGSDKPPLKVFIGTKVTVSFDGDEDREDYHICLPDHSNPDNGVISFISPVGRQLLLKNTGDQISLSVPNGHLNVTIEKITFSDQYSL
ncbi:GreA/GreB family elongation factor [Bacillus sp. REN3]|uniref:GreA/GreB family elongation factor n=1 Tax=Bacillus sp. REN3 TaxID=2802440 RepID=UPI001AEF0FAF|nr:GreA/GreB family elongation factor [Bacillus sp. REN3]